MLCSKLFPPLMCRFFFLSRDRHRDKHRDLLPLICKELRTLEVSEAFLPFEVVMKASDGMFHLYKDRLASAERDNRREWTRKGMDLVRLVDP